jgi:hypothetical protein
LSNPPLIRDSASRRSGVLQTAAEVALVFLVFFLQGAWPVPEVNEPYYIGKAIHYWNPGWIADDPFLDSADTHTVFYFSLGWLAVVLPPVVAVWAGRLITWGLLAWSWQRLSRAVVPRRWASIWTAALFVCLTEHGHMAGEWVVGGVEAKGFAYVLTFLGLEALARGLMHRVWPLLGAAAAFHVLVGGWAVVAAMLAWILLGKTRPRLRPMIPWLLLGLVLSLPGLLPSLALTRGVDPRVVAFANEIYVFRRLAHHLDPAGFPPGFVLRFVALAAIWAACSYWPPPSDAIRRLRAFVAGTLLLSLAGAAVAIGFAGNPARAAGLLRFYWFRLSDVAVPLGVALAGPSLLVALGPVIRRNWPHDRRLTMAACGAAVLIAVAAMAWLMVRVVAGMAGYPIAWEAAAAASAAIVLGGLWWLENRAAESWVWRRARVAAVAALAAGLLLAAPAAHLVNAARLRCTPLVPRADRLWDYWAWEDACRWITESGEVPLEARFLTPLMGQTFKWYAQRSEVVSWKDIPQDAESIVDWWKCALDIHRRDDCFSGRGWSSSLSRLDGRRLRYLGEKYGANYLITYRWPWRREFLFLYGNRTYAIYRLDRPPARPPWLPEEEPPADLQGEPEINPTAVP